MPTDHLTHKAFISDFDDDSPTSDWSRVRNNPEHWGLRLCPCGLACRLDRECDHGEDPSHWEPPTCKVCDITADWLLFGRIRASMSHGYGSFIHEAVCDEHVMERTRTAESQGYEVITPELF